MPTQIAVQGYTLRDFAKTPEDVAKTCARIKKIGYDAVQVSAWAKMPAPELARILAGEGLICCATHVGWDEMLKETQRVIDEHKIIKCQYVAIGSGPKVWSPDRPKGEGFWKDFARQASDVGRKTKAQGISFGYHNHAVEFEKVSTRTIMDIIVDETDPAAVTMELDTFWVQHGGADPAAFIRRCQGRSPTLHLKDMTIVDNKITMAEVGEGNLNWPAILAAAKDAGTKWYIVEQDTCRRDPFESVAISLRNLQAMGLH